MISFLGRPISYFELTLICALNFYLSIFYCAKLNCKLVILIYMCIIFGRPIVHPAMGWGPPMATGPTDRPMKKPEAR